MNIFLIGFMGVGKTTIGKALAEKFNYTFYDTDDLIIDKFNIQDGDLLGFFEDRKEENKFIFVSFSLRLSWLLKPD